MHAYVRMHELHAWCITQASIDAMLIVFIYNHQVNERSILPMSHAHSNPAIHAHAYMMPTRIYMQGRRSHREMQM